MSHAFRTETRWSAREEDGARAHAPERLRGSGLADRFCAWAGRSGRRSIFSVIGLEGVEPVEDLPLAPGTIVLGVRRERGRRHVLWAAILPAAGPTAAIRHEAAALAARGDGELHLHVLAADAAERDAIVDDLGFPRLDRVASMGAIRQPHRQG